jgi:Ca2+-binding RTX toxin-like protein
VNEGNDILYTTVSYNLGENQVEAMSVADQMTTNAVNLIGNYVSQIIVGNYGDNVLNGGTGGVDTLVGLFGNDTYAVGDARMMIIEQAGQGFDTAVTSVSYTLGAGVSVEVFTAQDRNSTTGLRLGGNELDQTIGGTAGADTISGGGGRDVLLGGAGADTFVIGPVAAGNVAVLADFVSGTDRIGLTSTAFNVGASLDASEFVAGTAASTADQRVIYDAGTGQLFYDADGNGAGAAVLFAQVVPGTAITAASFDVVVPTATTA